MTTTLKRLLLLAFGIGALIVGWHLYRERRDREAAERQLGLDSSRILTAVFTNARDLRVARLTGQVLARSQNDGTVFRTWQETKAPYAVSYFVDLAKIGPDDMRWDAERKRMLVYIPDVVAELPAIGMDEAETKVGGMWVSRQAGMNLNRTAARTLMLKVDERAKSDAMIEKARDAAVRAVTSYVAQPLTAAGIRDVSVSVRFDWEGRQSSEEWNRSRRVADVIGNGA